jgi:hypothetical protein
MMASARIVSLTISTVDLDAIAYNQVQVDIVCAQILQARINPFFNDMVPRVVQLRRQPYFLSWYARVFDPLANFCFIAIC